VVIGGNGSQSGAEKLSRLGFKVVGVASTIDNDLVGSDITIGVDTALNIALEAIDRLKVTASSHQRALLVEVMGRNCGYLALMSGIAGGAEAIAIPEVETDPEEIAREILSAYERGKPHAIVVVAEGARYNAEGLVNFFKQNNDRLGFAVRTTVIGHVQRGGGRGACRRASRGAGRHAQGRTLDHAARRGGRGQEAPGHGAAQAGRHSGKVVRGGSPEVARSWEKSRALADGNCCIDDPPGGGPNRPGSGFRD
jgi:hypothetical protein